MRLRAISGGPSSLTHGELSRLVLPEQHRAGCRGRSDDGDSGLGGNKFSDAGWSRWCEFPLGAEVVLAIAVAPGQEARLHRRQAGHSIAVGISPGPLGVTSRKAWTVAGLGHVIPGEMVVVSSGGQLLALQLLRPFSDPHWRPCRRWGDAITGG